MTTLNDILLAAENLVSQIQQYQSERTSTVFKTVGNTAGGTASSLITDYVNLAPTEPPTTPEPPKEEETVTEETAPTEEVDTLESRLAKQAEEAKQATDPLAL